MKSKRASLMNNNPLDEMFSSSAPIKKQSDKSSNSAESPTTKQTTFILFEDQLDWLDEICFNAKRKGGKRINKTAVIRCLVALARNKGLTLEGVRTEEDIYARLVQIMK